MMWWLASCGVVVGTRRPLPDLAPNDRKGVNASRRTASASAVRRSDVACYSVSLSVLVLENFLHLQAPGHLLSFAVPNDKPAA